LWNECCRLITNCIIYYNASILSRLLAHKEAAGDGAGTEEERSEDEQELWQRLQQNTTVVEIHTLAQQFRSMFRQRQAAQLDSWLAARQSSEVPELRNFAMVLQPDYAAVKAAMSLAWSQGPFEGHIHRVKLIKRSGYGRANFDVLRKRVFHAV
jgi:transposase